MTSYLLDTNVLLRAADSASTQHQQAIQAITNLLAAGERVYITAQNLIEFWAVATRLRDANGLGWSGQQVRGYLQQLLQDFSFLEDTPSIVTYWLYLVTTHGIVSKRVHDTRLVAVMMVYNSTHILTYNLTLRTTEIW